MSPLPLRKDDEKPQELTTAEIASPKRPRPVESPYGEQSRLQREEQANTGSGQEVATTSAATESASFFPDNELQEMQTSWDRIQTSSLTNRAVP
jgi:hypothetical protein